MAEDLVVQIADMKIKKNDGNIITYALGSCVGIALHDPVLKLTSLIHILLPDSPKDNRGGNNFKFADTAIPATLSMMAKMGGVKSRYICKIAGGASMFNVSTSTLLGSIGDRNVAKTKEVLAKEGIRIAAHQTGGEHARTMIVDVATGEVTIRSVGNNNQKL